MATLMEDDRRESHGVDSMDGEWAAPADTSHYSVKQDLLYSYGYREQMTEALVTLH